MTMPPLEGQISRSLLEAASLEQLQSLADLVNTVIISKKKTMQRQGLNENIEGLRKKQQIDTTKTSPTDFLALQKKREFNELPAGQEYQSYSEYSSDEVDDEDEDEGEDEDEDDNGIGDDINNAQNKRQNRSYIGNDKNPSIRKVPTVTKDSAASATPLNNSSLNSSSAIIDVLSHQVNPYQYNNNQEHPTSPEKSFQTLAQQNQVEQTQTQGQNQSYEDWYAQHPYYATDQVQLPPSGSTPTSPPPPPPPHPLPPPPHFYHHYSYYYPPPPPPPPHRRRSRCWWRRRGGRHSYHHLYHHPPHRHHHHHHLPFHYWPPPPPPPPPPLPAHYYYQNYDPQAWWGEGGGEGEVEDAENGQSPHSVQQLEQQQQQQQLLQYRQQQQQQQQHVNDKRLENGQKRRFQEQEQEEQIDEAPNLPSNIDIDINIASSGPTFFKNSNATTLSHSQPPIQLQTQGQAQQPGTILLGIAEVDVQHYYSQYKRNDYFRQRNESDEEEQEAKAAERQTGDKQRKISEGEVEVNATGANEVNRYGVLGIDPASTTGHCVNSNVNANGGDRTTDEDKL